MLKEYLLNPRGEKFGIEETVVSFIKIDHLLSKIIEADIKRFEYLSEILSEELSKIQPKNLSLELTEFGYRSSIKTLTKVFIVVFWIRRLKSSMSLQNIFSNTTRKKLLSLLI